MSNNLTPRDQGLVVTPPADETEAQLDLATRFALKLLKDTMRGKRRLDRNTKTSPFEPTKEQLQAATETLRAYAAVRGKVKTPEQAKRTTVSIKNAVINPGRGETSAGRGGAGSINAMTSATHNSSAVVEGSAKEIHEAMKRGA